MNFSANPTTAIICPDDTERFDYIIEWWIDSIWTIEKFKPIPVSLN